MVTVAVTSSPSAIGHFGYNFVNALGFDDLYSSLYSSRHDVGYARICPSRGRVFTLLQPSIRDLICR